MAGLPVARLREAWTLSGGVQYDSASSRARRNLVVLRSALMDALETTDPDFASWLGAQQLRPGRSAGSS